MSTGSPSFDRKCEAKAHGLLQSLYSGMYPEFTGMEGPTDDTDPKDNRAPPKGSYNSCSSGGNNYFVFHDRKVVSFVTNVFPQSMKGKVYRGQVWQKSGVAQSVPPLLPAYNKFMGAVDKTDQLHKYYAFDHKCKRPWMQIFFHLFEFAINNAHILYQHNCKKVGLLQKDIKDLLAFRLELVHLLEGYSCRKRRRPSFHDSEGTSTCQTMLI